MNGFKYNYYRKNARNNSYLQLVLYSYDQMHYNNYEHKIALKIRVI